MNKIKEIQKVSCNNYNMENINGMMKVDQFFGRSHQELTEIANKSRDAQQRLKVERRLLQLKEKQPKQKLKSNVTCMAQAVVIDYLRSKNLNYVYSVMMRGANLLSDEIICRQKLKNLCNLDHAQQPYSTSVLQLLLTNTNLKTVAAVQCQIISSDDIDNKPLSLTDYAKIKQQFKIQFLNEWTDNKIKQHKQFSNQNQKALNKIKTQLHQVKRQNNVQKNTINELRNKYNEMECLHLAHNCLNNDIVIQRQNKIEKQKREVEKKKIELDFALKNMHSKVDNLMLQKIKILDNKPTEQFLIDKRKVQQCKSIQEIYKKMFVLDKRIQVLSQQNQSLRSKLQEYQSQCKKQSDVNPLQIKQKPNELVKKQQNFRHQQLAKTNKVQMKNVCLGVKEEDLALKIKNEFIEEDQQNIDRDTQYRQNIQSLASEMKLIKNKIRLFAKQLV